MKHVFSEESLDDYNVNHLFLRYVVKEKKVAELKRLINKITNYNKLEIA